MRTKTMGFTLGAMLFALCFPAEAQQPKKVARIGYLSNSDPAGESSRCEAIRLALRALGHIEGQNIAKEYDIRRGISIGSLSLRLSWCVSGSMSSW